MSNRFLSIAVTMVGVAMVIYHLVYSQTYIQGMGEHLIFHLGFALILVFLTSLQKSSKHWPLKLATVLLAQVFSSI